ncbi:uncharacterized protein LOC121390228 [Gigantopelta aegis]|uniref:uncharacterized protein LOC121390228 n=1 Tax=Gigantopelta aegis TaxID=1735272 RepID=UPI001B888D27|nr:uncharacterized protein LOC121390228 [Gigantopelta aegis]
MIKPTLVYVRAMHIHTPPYIYNLLFTLLGSPVKSENLPSKRKLPMSDPRPVEFRDQPGFEDRARSFIINYCSNTNQDLTMKYLYEKADILTAANDHHYLALPLTEYWVDKSLHVTEEFARILEINTRGRHSVDFGTVKENGESLHLDLVKSAMLQRGGIDKNFVNPLFYLLPCRHHQLYMTNNMNL